MAEVFISLMGVTGVPGAITGATIAPSSSACFDAAQRARVAQPMLVFDSTAAKTFADSLPNVFWDIESDTTRGLGLDPRTCSRRHARNNCRRLSKLLLEVQDQWPSLRQWVYRSFPASLLYASGYTAAQRAAFVEAGAFMRQHIGTDNHQGPCTDLYYYGQMDTWSQAQIEAAVAANVTGMQEAWPDADKYTVFVCAENHPGGTNPMQPVNNTRWGWLLAKLATYADVDVVLWGGYTTISPVVTTPWATYSARAQWATFKTAWGLP